MAFSLTGSVAAPMAYLSPWTTRVLFSFGKGAWLAMRSGTELVLSHTLQPLMPELTEFVRSRVCLVL